MIILWAFGCTGPDTGDSAAAADTADTAADTADTGGPGHASPYTAAELVAWVRVDGAAAMAAIGNEVGWPAPTTDGLLVLRLGGGAWSVAGDFDGWVGAAMTCDEALCWALVEATTGGYKFTDGAEWEPDPYARRYRYDEFGELSLVASADAHLERWFAVGDDAMAPRSLFVRVPTEPVTHVLYAQDGRNLFDPDAFYGGWLLQEHAPPGMLVVGIDNTAARMDEYTHVSDTLDGVAYGGQGDAYADFVQGTVRPFVRARYGEPGPVGVLGSSLGGLISLHIADRFPGEYDFAASMSGTLGWGSFEQHNETLIERHQGAGHAATVLYLDSGGGGTTCADSDGDGVRDDDTASRDNYCETIQLRDVLLAEGYTNEVDLWHWWEPDAPHTEAAWGARVERPLGVFANLR